MVFYNSSFYHTDLRQYDCYYDSDQSEPLMTQSSHEPSFCNLFDYPPLPYLGAAYDSGIDFSVNARSVVSHSAYACSASTLCVPRVIEYDPSFCGDSNQKVSTQFLVSYSVSEFNEPEFDEYDPTPYGGGYDISQTYGKALPPSNEICYPPSSSSAPPVKDVSSKESIELQNKEEQKAEKEAKEGIEEKEKPSNGNKQIQRNEDNDTDSEGEESEETMEDLGSGYENGRDMEGDYDYGRPVNQFPNGYGLEAMDLCETLFGYWPCLSRIKKQTSCRQGNTWEDCHGNLWQTAADYLFGSYYPYPHEQTREGDPAYCYERRYGEVGYLDNSWLTNLN